jgi:chorismate synthase
MCWRRVKGLVHHHAAVLLCLLRGALQTTLCVVSQPHVAAAAAAAAAAVLATAVINEVRTRGESCGGVVTCVVRGCPKGLGTPVFDKLEAELAKAMLSLPATKVCVCLLTLRVHGYMQAH